jgi:hypothetical protein
MTAAATAEPATPAAPAAPADEAVPNPIRHTLAPLAIDVAVPLGGYYLLHAGFGVGTAAALAITSVLPLFRTIAGFITKREANPLAALMLAVNVAALALTFLSGDARLMIAKDSAISSLIALGILWSVRAGRPMMSAGLKPFITKGKAQRVTAWDALRAEGDAAFRAKENLYSLIWGGALLTECLARLIGAFTLAPSTMAWLGTVFLLTAIGGACVVGGGAAVEPMEKLIAARIEAESAEATASNPTR